MQLMNIFQQNYDMLLAIFNPEGWLEITYPFFCLHLSSIRIVTSSKSFNRLMMKIIYDSKLIAGGNRVAYIALIHLIDMSTNPYGSEEMTRKTSLC
jgi:hypothetical protein